MFILDVPPELPSKVPVMMVQAGSNAKGNVVMQDLTPAPKERGPQTECMANSALEREILSAIK